MLGLCVFVLNESNAFFALTDCLVEHISAAAFEKLQLKPTKNANNTM